MQNIFLRNTVRTVALTSVLFAFASCDCDNCDETPTIKKESATLTLNLTSSSGEQTRSTQTPTDGSDNTISTVDVLVFTGGEQSSPSYGLLDTYKQFQNVNGSLEIQTTTGDKKICVVANAHNLNLGQITSYQALSELVTTLDSELFGDFTMYGEKDQTLQVQNQVTVDISRFIARITVSSISTRFDGTPYEGISLTNCKLYLIDAYGNKYLTSGNAPVPGVILNKDALSTTDMNGVAQAGLLYDEIATAIGESGYSTPHYLHCYSNETSVMTDCTKLVLEAELDGVKYYYPIPINQEGYGYKDGNGHYGIKRNTKYSCSIVVTRPGSLEPDTPLTPGTLELSINILGWTQIDSFEKVF